MVAAKLASRADPGNFDLSIWCEALLKVASILGLLVMIVALAALFRIGALISPQPSVIALQVIAVVLFVWARLTFGRRSFHAAANPTPGGLVTTGPYRYIRHPIYTAACLFALGGVLSHLSALSATLGVLLFVGGLIRMLCEERLVTNMYPEYLAYKKSAKRMLPYVF